MEPSPESNIRNDCAVTSPMQPARKWQNSCQTKKPEGRRDAGVSRVGFGEVPDLFGTRPRNTRRKNGARLRHTRAVRRSGYLIEKAF